MNSTMVDVVRRCAEKGIRSSRAEVDRFSSAHAEGIVLLRDQLGKMSAIVTKVQISHASAAALQSVHQIEARIAAVEHAVKSTARTLIDRLIRLPDLLVTMLHSVGTNALTPSTPDVVCPRVEIAMRPHLASVSAELRKTKIYADHELQKAQKEMAMLGSYVDRLRRSVSLRACE